MIKESHRQLGQFSALVSEWSFNVGGLPREQTPYAQQYDQQSDGQDMYIFKGREYAMGNRINSISESN